MAPTCMFLPSAINSWKCLESIFTVNLIKIEFLKRSFRGENALSQLDIEHSFVVPTYFLLFLSFYLFFAAKPIARGIASQGDEMGALPHQAPGPGQVPGTRKPASARGESQDQAERGVLKGGCLLIRRRVWICTKEIGFS